MFHSSHIHNSMNCSIPYSLALPEKPCTVQQLKHESASHFGQQPCQWQSEIGFQLGHKKNLVTISATGSGKSLTFWLPMPYENGLTLIIVPLKNLGQQLADKSSWSGFCAISITRELLALSPTMFRECGRNYMLNNK